MERPWTKRFISKGFELRTTPRQAIYCSLQLSCSNLMIFWTAWLRFQLKRMSTRPIFIQQKIPLEVVLRKMIRTDSSFWGFGNGIHITFSLATFSSNVHFSDILWKLLFLKFICVLKSSFIPLKSVLEEIKTHPRTSYQESGNRCCEKAWLAMHIIKQNLKVSWHLF